MSVWTQVECEVFTPDPMTKEELVKAFGKEFDDGERPDYNDVTFGSMTKDEYRLKQSEWFKRNTEAWEDYKAHEKDYLPTGSEGSLHYAKTYKTSDERYVYRICGNLRDWDNDMEIVKWFRNKFLGLILLNSEEHNDFYGLVKASSGLGEVYWEYGRRHLPKKVVTENET